MIDFIDHMIFVCFTGAAIGIALVTIGGLFELINYLAKGKFQNWIVNLFSE